jgi:hypothetical protein
MFKNMKRAKGSVLVLVTLVLVVLIGMSALVIDGGMIFTARNQLQSAADSAALAGAAFLIINRGEATRKAVAFGSLNKCINEPVVLKAANVTFPDDSQIRIDATHSVDLYFARVFGMRSADITATAVAGLTGLRKTGEVKPWAIPDLNYVLGEQVTIKAGELGAEAAPAGFFYPVDFPPLNKGTPITGGSAYSDNIIAGSSVSIEIGDELQVEPGNNVGPTMQGINDLIAMDPTAYWAGDHVAGSIYIEYSSPRICKVPFYDVNFPPDSGRNTVIVIRLGAFFLEGTQGNNVIGRFISVCAKGEGGSNTSDLKMVQLVG